MADSSPVNATTPSATPSALRDRHCQDLPKGSPALGHDEVQYYLGQLDGWQLTADGDKLSKTFKFEDFYKTMGFVNTVAHVANSQNHHPDLDVSYGQCTVTFWTHTVGGLSENDFICAAKIDAMG